MVSMVMALGVAWVLDGLEIAGLPTHLPNFESAALPAAGRTVPTWREQGELAEDPAAGRAASRRR